MENDPRQASLTKGQIAALRKIANSNPRRVPGGFRLPGQARINLKTFAELMRRRYAVVINGRAVATSAGHEFLSRQK